MTFQRYNHTKPARPLLGTWETFTTENSVEKTCIFVYVFMEPRSPVFSVAQALMNGPSSQVPRPPALSRCSILLKGSGPSSPFLLWSYCRSCSAREFQCASSHRRRKGQIRACRAESTLPIRGREHEKLPTQQTFGLKISSPTEPVWKVTGRGST